MDREILFRGKRIDNGEWVYGFLIMCKYTRNDNGNLYYVTKPNIVPVGNIGEAEYDGDGNFYQYAVIPETVGQCVGLRDKNGELIFEGDILEFVNDVGEKIEYTVIWDDDFAGWIISDMDTSICGMDCWDNHKYRVEVISNIHDNPELLKGE